MTADTEGKVGMRDVLAVGVVLVEHFGIGHMRLAKIVRHTPTQAITDRGTKYRLEDGRRVGDYGSANIATEAHYAEIKHARLVQSVRRAWQEMRSLDAMTDERLAALLAILTEEPNVEAR